MRFIGFDVVLFKIKPLLKTNWVPGGSSRFPGSLGFDS